MLFERAFAALWQRAKTPLGPITLVAIVDRVLHEGVRRFPVLSVLEVDDQGLKTTGLAERASTAAPGEVTDAIQRVLEEFLTVVGNLTGEILTPALHAELAKVRLEDAVSSETTQKEPPGSTDTDGGGTGR